MGICSSSLLNTFYSAKSTRNLHCIVSVLVFFLHDQPFFRFSFFFVVFIMNLKLLELFLLRSRGLGDFKDVEAYCLAQWSTLSDCNNIAKLYISEILEENKNEDKIDWLYFKIKIILS